MMNVVVSILCARAGVRESLLISEFLCQVGVANLLSSGLNEF